MNFWDAFWPALLAFLVGTVMLGAAAWLYARFREPRIILRALGSTHDPVREPMLRWYHAEVLWDGGPVAFNPDVMVWPLDDAKDFEQWAWPGHKVPTAIHRTPLLIPIVAGNLDPGNSQPIGGGQVFLAPSTWYITPDDAGRMGRAFAFQAHTTRRYRVRVSWLRNGTTPGHKEAAFALRFGATPQSEPTFLEVRLGRWRAQVIRRGR